MAKFKPYKILESQLDSLPIKEGQFILTIDTNKLYSDTAEDTRILISSDLIKDLSVNGKTITYTRLDGTTGTIETQDTTYSVASTIKNGLMSADDKVKLNSIESNAQRNTVTGVKGDSETLYRTGNINITKSNIGLSNVENKSSAAIREELTSTNIITALDFTPISSDLKGANGGLAELDSTGKIPTSQLPSYVDDVVEYLTKEEFPIPGENGKIYIETSTNKSYRWGGSVYAEISSSLALGTTSSSAFRGDHGEIAYKHATDANAINTTYETNLYKIGATAEGHIKECVPATKEDITSLGIPGQDTTYENATVNNAGLMSKVDKAKLDGIDAGAQKNTVFGVKGGAESEYRVGNINITKANIGLGNVDNTADINKTVLAAKKADKLVPVCIIGSDSANPEGWYKVADSIMSGYGNTNLTLLIKSGYKNGHIGLLQLEMRSDNTKVACWQCKWLVRMGIPQESVRITIDGMKWTMYYKLDNTQYGRTSFVQVQHGNIHGDTITYAVNYYNTTTKESTEPTASAKSSDGGLVYKASNADYATKAGQDANGTDIRANYLRKSSDYLNTHPENSGTILPFMNNDIAFLTERGGAAKLFYDGVEQNISIANAFDASTSYWYCNPTGVTTIVIELTLHKVFTWTNTIYVDHGAAGWRSKNTKIEVINTNYADDVWTTKYSNTAQAKGNLFATFNHTPVGASNGSGGFNKIRFTFSDWVNPTIFRIAQLGVLNYGSAGLRETNMSRGIDDGVLRNITPYHDKKYTLGSATKRWLGAHIKNLVLYGSAAENPLMTRGIVGSDGSGNVGELHLQYNVDYPIKLGKTAAHSISADGSQYSGNAATATNASKVNGLTVQTAVPANAKFTDTTYTFATGDANGQIKVTPSGGNAQNISVKGLGSLAYKSDISADDVGALSINLKGVANGLAELDSNGKVPASQLPSYVDDTLEGYLYNGKFYKESAHTTEIIGETSKIYVDLSTNKTYRWSGSSFVEISASLALGTTSSTAFRGDYGNTAYKHAIDENAINTATANGLYKIGSTAEGHIASLQAITKNDITALGIPAQDTTYQEVTTSAAGLMTATDKIKLNTIEEGAQKNTVTGIKGNAETNYRVGNVNITPTNIGLGNVENKSSATIRSELTKDNVTDALGYTPPTVNTTYEEATTSKAGLMSAAMVTKLNGIEVGAQKNTVTGVKGNSESTYRTGNINITKANIGLGNVDNTSDANKPVSTATQTELNKKLNLSGGTLTGPLKWEGSSALPGSTNLQYILGIDAFADGGQTKYINANALKVSQATSDGDGNVITSTYKRVDGTSRYLILTGGDGNTTGYRLVLQETMTAWKNCRLVLSIASRHQGTGILSIGLSTGSTVAEFQQEARFYGSAVSYTSDSWIQYYNKETGVYTLFWKFNDYSSCNVNILERLGFTSKIQNGEWMTSIDATTYGDKYSVLINKASSASNADKATNDKNGNDIATTYVKKSGDTMTGELDISGVPGNGGQIRIYNGGSTTKYGTIFRNDGDQTYILLTNAGEQNGTWNNLRPFRINNSDGAINIGTSLATTTLSTTNTSDSTSATTGSVKVAGGIGIAKAINGGSTITAAAALKSTEGTVDLANSSAQMKYNSTDKCIDFIFS